MGPPRTLAAQTAKGMLTSYGSETSTVPSDLTVWSAALSSAWLVMVSVLPTSFTVVGLLKSNAAPTPNAMPLLSLARPRAAGSRSGQAAPSTPPLADPG